MPTTTKTYVYRSGGSFWAMFLILLGVVFLLDNMNVFTFDVWDIFWPLVIILIGVRVMTKRRHRIEVNVDVNSSQSSVSSSTSTMSGGAVNAKAKVVGSSSDYVNDSMVGGDLDHYIQSKSFRGGTLSNVFGEVEVDLSAAELADGEQMLSLSTVFGNVKIIVPGGMDYLLEGTTVFGEVQVDGNKRGGIFSNVNFSTVSYKDAAKKLHVIASTVFGEVKLVTKR
ncbi:MAG TPA: cell wall-active antibiotics response protein LiaF [Candidatus Kapabacteria bacterium]|nr:cell wall-active antibiotics response protein LiaF [Candidatus Kapabacteria bacterium]